MEPDTGTGGEEAHQFVLRRLPATAQLLQVEEEVAGSCLGAVTQPLPEVMFRDGPEHAADRYPRA